VVISYYNLVVYDESYKNKKMKMRIFDSDDS